MEPPAGPMLAYVDLWYLCCALDYMVVQGIKQITCNILEPLQRQNLLQCFQSTRLGPNKTICVRYPNKQSKNTNKQSMCTEIQNFDTTNFPENIFEIHPINPLGTPINPLLGPRSGHLCISCLVFNTMSGLLNWSKAYD